MMFNTINWLRLALITSFIFGCCCSQNEVYKYLEENALCENEKPIVSFPNSERGISTTTLDEFRGNQGLVIVLDGKPERRIINSKPDFIDTAEGYEMPSWVDSATQNLLNHYKVLTLSEKEVKKLLSGCQGVSLLNLDEGTMRGALVDPTPVSLEEIKPGEFAIVYVPTYACLAIINHKYELVNMHSAKTSIDDSAASLCGFVRYRNISISRKIPEMLLPSYIPDKSGYRIERHTYITLSKPID